MTTVQQQPSIWATMAYIPPRGPCSQKASIMSSCPCYRFMIHPLKAATSFDCDGCGHHASFHRMENREEDEIAKRWKAQEEHRMEEAVRRTAEFGRIEEVVEARVPAKRRRIADLPASQAEVVLNLVEGEVGERALAPTRKRKGKGDK